MHFLKFFKTIFQETKRYDPEDYEMWKQIQMSKDDNDLSEKIYNGLETLIQEKISDFPEVN